MSTRGGLRIVGIIILAVVATAMLAGCAQPFSGVCAVKPLGQDGAGNAYVMAYCEPK